MIRLILILILIGLPIAEIAVFIAVGSAIGILPTIAITILTAIAGATLLKRQGVSVLAKLQADLQNDEIPTETLGEAATIAVAGMLLLTPGFITDVVGLALFVPGLRRWLGRHLVGNARIVRGGATASANWSSHRPGRAKTIDLEEGEFSRADPNSPWSDQPRR